MKFYNYWKPHIVEDGFGKFCIRVLTFTGWCFYNERRNEFSWVFSPTFYKSVETAQEALASAISQQQSKKKGYKVVQ